MSAKAKKKKPTRMRGRTVSAAARGAPAKGKAATKRPARKPDKAKIPGRRSKPVARPRRGQKPPPPAKRSVPKPPAASMAEKLTANGANLRKRMFKRAKLPRNYMPSDSEPFMGNRQLGFFKNKLLDWRDELLRESSQTIMNLQEGGLAEPDLADRASAESDRSLELRTRDRERKLISKIDAALERIEIGTYGYCEETGEPIGLKRLMARPIATLSIEAQERHERREKVYRDD